MRPSTATVTRIVSIKGNILQARARYVRDRAGEVTWKKILDRLSVHDRAVLGGMILPMNWYPMELGLRLDDAIAAELSPSDPKAIFLEMGRASADLNLAGAEKVFVRRGDPMHLLKMAPQIYGFYYQVGRRTFEKLSPTSGVIRTFDAESVTPSDCLTVMGWHHRGLELSGAKGIVATHPVCRASDGAHCEYCFSWQSVER